MNLSDFEAEVRSFLSQESQSFFHFQVLKEVDSTNNLLLKKSQEGADEGTLIVAERQTAGKGTRGRSFFSELPQALYFSLLLRPHALPPQTAVKITAAAAVSVCRALEQRGSETAQIKWVNDIYLKNKKICGILTQALFSQNGFPEAIVCGIGINLAAPPGGFPPEIADVAGAVFSDSDEAKAKRAAVLAAVLENLRAFYLSLKETGDIGCNEEYRNRSLLIGKEVFVTRNEQSEKATVLDIDSQCRLVVRFEATNTTEALIAGDVSLHGTRF